MCAAMAAGKPVEVDSLPTIADGLAVKEVNYSFVITYYILHLFRIVVFRYLVILFILEYDIQLLFLLF